MYINDELALSTGFEVGDMAIASHDVEGEATWILVRVENIFDDGTYQCQAFNTQDAKLRIGKRKYLPVYAGYSKVQRVNSVRYLQRSLAQYQLHYPM